MTTDDQIPNPPERRSVRRNERRRVTPEHIAKENTDNLYLVPKGPLSPHHIEGHHPDCQCGPVAGGHGGEITSWGCKGPPGTPERPAEPSDGISSPEGPTIDPEGSQGVPRGSEVSAGAGGPSCCTGAEDMQPGDPWACAPGCPDSTENLSPPAGKAPEKPQVVLKDAKGLSTYLAALDRDIGALLDFKDRVVPEAVKVIGRQIGQMMSEIEAMKKVLEEMAPTALRRKLILPGQ